jgi:uncharacterized protein YrrD
MHIRIGARVMAEDGPAGRVERLILHPQTSEIEGVVAVQGGMLKQDVVVPVERIMAADDRAVYVFGTAAEISELAPFAQSQYTVPPEEWIPPADLPSSRFLFPLSPYTVGAFVPATQAVYSEDEVEALEPGDVEVSGSTEVLCRDGVAGRLDRVVTEGDSDRVTHLVIQRGPLGRRDVAVPVDQVESIGDAGIRLALTEEELDELELSGTP